ncbi:MAG: phosphoenolpyruvate--protein phosphotransferase [Spirochaetales bacterium]|jgi:phosphotransferase system enzyme I (PtsI)|nr:phosphoenolpyruvate--protein phosphotransferase [Spirochaetales bacterium]
MQQLEGVTASPGLAAGRIYRYEAPDLQGGGQPPGSPEEEQARLEGAYLASFRELEKIKNSLSGSLGETYGHIFRAQMTMLEDEDFKQEIKDKLKPGGLTAETALEQTHGEYSLLFAQMEENSYNAQRLADLEDVSRRLRRNLLGREEVSLACLPPESLVAAEELFPSDTALMDRKNIRGFVTEKGGRTSHVAILAKSLGLPAAVGVPGVMAAAAKGDEAILDVRDYDRAFLYLNPDGETAEKLKEQGRAYDESQEELLKMKDLEPVTRDGKKITLSANIGSVEDLCTAMDLGAKSVGLFRTEFLFLKSPELPGEEEQFKVYAEAARKLKGGMLIIRTLDIGGDKEVPALALPKEDNPFLGLRGIRVCLKNRDLFLTQLRALLRAAAEGDIRIMFPMISSVQEFRLARDLVREAAADLAARGVPHKPDPPLGVMVETPAAVFLADELTREGSFVSLGTNDLTQYVLCVDRGNQELSSYYQTFHPGLFRGIAMTAGAAVKNGKWAGVCGELASHPQAVPLLIGLGVEELSVTPQLFPQTLAVIRGLNYEECRGRAQKALSLATDDEIRAFLQSRGN